MAETTRRRISGIDAARGIALLGMMAAHVFPLWDTGVTAEPNVVGLVFSGRSSALFAVLAGVGLALLTGGSRPHTGRDLRADRTAITVRAAFIGLVGMLLGYLNVNIAIIMVHYAVLFLCALPFLHLRLRVLAAWAGGWLLLSPVLAFVLRPWALENVQPAGVLEHNVVIEDFFTPAALLSDLFLTGFYPVLQWLSYILIGLAIGRLDLLRTTIQLRLLAGGIAAAASAKAVSWFVMGQLGGYEQVAATEGAQRPDFEIIYQVNLGWIEQEDSWWWLGSSSPHAGSSLDLLHTSGTAAIVLAVCLLLTGRLPGLLLPLSGAGAMTLSLYSAHVWTMSWADAIPGVSDGVLYWFQVIIVLALGTVFAAFHWRGPLESMTSTFSQFTRDGIRGSGIRHR
ncbi:heparan-alpha-glucosaminide N-acetyltransferase domain-containing protein [Crystallibacter degradans]|uniref:heparan-alpha-glucosaminide N-acetyltransferase domain-containing protein n=1 Tax=Crystallibacter degradans TaxID=2726743 RepID=UPI0014729FFA|nr:heparan-alpha-glucosaminide N-acetyltransferase domain-containing protein [Arthrobacter sp. SF27]NMR31202.1 DUF1624 domain-containing protein [Arthrobacter sp. SF27]